MVTFRHITPHTITLLTTFRCNAACDNCCLGCRPGVGRTMTLDEMKYYIDTCIKAYPESIISVSFTGGECFLLGSVLDEIIRYSHQRGLSVGLVTNGFWGKSYSEATKRIESLKKNGLGSITFSVGEDHQHILPLVGCRNAVVAAARAGYNVSLRLETDFAGRSTILNKLEKDVPFMRLVKNGKIKIVGFEWRKFNNEIRHPQSYPWHIGPYGKFEPCKSLNGTISITPYGDVLACAGIACARIPALRLGNIWKQPLVDMYNSITADMLKVWILRKGPQDVLQYVYENSKIRFHDTGPHCDSCMEIFGNPKIIPFLKETYNDWAQKLR